MTNKELIMKLLEFPMDATVAMAEYSADNEDQENNEYMMALIKKSWLKEAQ